MISFVREYKDSSPYYTLYFLYFALAFYPNAKATQIVLPILHFDFSSYFGKFGVLSKDYIIFSKYDYYDSKKQYRSVPNAKTFVWPVFSDPTQATKRIV